VRPALKIVGGIILALLGLGAGGCVVSILASYQVVTRSGGLLLLAIPVAICGTCLIGAWSLLKDVGRPSGQMTDLTDAEAEERHQRNVAKHIKQLEREDERKKRLRERE
jgi:hypothetical protein